MLPPSVYGVLDLVMYVDYCHSFMLPAVNWVEGGKLNQDILYGAMRTAEISRVISRAKIIAYVCVKINYIPTAK